ncbi:hypothetical protein ASF57_23595 [Methylobacterium sp. Leaf117]|nr:hypothetical protein ASF57_23595 [Methylobacterium sp. Leaf117]
MPGVYPRRCATVIVGRRQSHAHGSTSGEAMKRDMDLVRSILIEIEEGRYTFDFDTLKVETDDQMYELMKLKHHIAIMVQAELINLSGNSPLWREDAPYNQIEVVGLTWKGHDFVDAIRDPAVWRKTKEGASKVGGAGFGFILELGKAYAKQELQKLGLPLL